MQADDLLLKKLIIMGGVYVFTNELFNTLLVPTRLEGKANYYNTLNSIRAALSFMLLIAFTFIGNHQIEAFFFAPLTVNLGMILFLIKKPLQYFRIFPSTFFLRHSMRFIKFGSGNLLYNVGIFLLVSSDRYIIALFESNSTVGIYNQTYNIGQITITALFTIILAALNPVVIPSLEKNPLKSNNLLYSGLYSVFYIVTPFVLMGSFFSYEITVLLLGESFREAWQIIPVILLSTLFAGCNHFAVVKLKFLNKLNALFLSALGASLINIGLNLLLIPIWGYKIAAFTTLVSYVGLLIALFKLADLNPIENKNIRKNFLRILVALLLISLIHYTTKGFAIYKDNLVINAIIKSIIYIIVFYLLTHRYFPFNEEANKQTNI